MLITNYFIFIFLIIHLSNVNSINPLIYGKIIDWYEQTHNLSWFDNEIYFDSYITQETGIGLITSINRTIGNKHEMDIFIALNTNGGDLLMAYKIISYMNQMRMNYRIKFHCVCIKTYSSGFYIFQLCDYRYWIDGSSTIMVHEPKLNIEGTFEYVKKYVENDFMLNYKNYQSIVNVICFKSNINISDYQNKIDGKDWTITSGLVVCLLNFADFYFKLT